MHAAQNYIYILFAVVYVIYSIIKGAKKVTSNRPAADKKPEESPTINPPTSSPLPNAGEDMKKMLEDLFGERQEEKTPEVVIPKAKPQVQHKKQVSFQKEHPKAGSHAHEKAKPIAAAEKPAAEKSKTVPQKAEEPVVIEETPDFDIRQAIIYSEILKRPQY